MNAGTRARDRVRADGGVTVTELAVGAVLAAIVVIMMATLLASGQRVERFTAEDSETLAELRTGLDRLSGELRQAREVYSDSTTTRVRFWVDENHDLQAGASERVTWEVVVGGAGDMQLVRSTDADTTGSVVSDDVLSGTTFTYSPAPPSTTAVTIRIEADVNPGSQADSRFVETEVRLRNAPTS